jgi:flagellar protein FliS
MYSAQNAASQYKMMNNEGALSASPHQLILMLMNGAQERMVQARAAMERKETALKGTLIGKATGIIAGLQASLDRSQAPDMVDNLERVYDYMQRRLFEANIKDDPAMIDEVCALLRDIKSSWEAIDPNRPAV